MLRFLRGCSYLFTFLIYSLFYRHIRLKSAAYFFVTHPVVDRVVVVLTFNGAHLYTPPVPVARISAVAASNAIFGI